MSSKFVIVALLVLFLDPPAHAGEADEGKTLSERHCSRCHVVGDHNPYGGIASTPSFSLLVNNLADWEDRFASFHNRLPHPSIVRFKGEAVDPGKPVLTVPIELDYTDIDAIVAFARTLKKNQ